MAAYHRDVRAAGVDPQSDLYDQRDRISVKSVIRKFTRNRKQYPNRDSALKLIYMAIHDAAKKWTLPIPKWKEALNHFAILFADRMPKTLN